MPRKSKEIDINFFLENKGEARILLKSSLKMFALFFHKVIQHEEFQIKDFHDELIKKLEDIAECRNIKKNLFIGLSPRSGKSLLMEYWIAWCYARNPLCQFISTSYAEEITNKFSDEIMAIIRHPVYNEIFGVKMSVDTSAKAQWKTNHGGRFRATPMQGSMTGFGAGSFEAGKFLGALIIDDPTNSIFMNSKAEMKKTINTYENSAKKRRNNLSVPIICIMQRLSVDDLIGYIKKSEAEDWDFYEVPALIENKDGTFKSFWEERFPVEELLKEKRQNYEGFMAQRQQNPIVRSGELVKKEWFQFYNIKQHNDYRRIFCTIDTAFKDNEWNDYTALGLWGRTPEKSLYLIDMLHKKIPSVDLPKSVIEFWNKWNFKVNGRRISALYIEDAASGMTLIQTLKKENRIPVIPFKTKNLSKLQRWSDLFPFIESGKLFLPEWEYNPISTELIQEFMGLRGDMNHEHDDIVDMTSMAFEIASRSVGLF